MGSTTRQGSQMKRSLITLVIIMLAPTAFAECEGNACEFMRIKQTNTCLEIENTHTSQDMVVSSSDETRDYQWTVPASGTTEALTDDGFCPSDWYRAGQRAQFKQTAST